MGRQRQWAAWMMVGLLWAPAAVAQVSRSTAPLTLAQTDPTTITGELSENSDTLNDGSYFNAYTFEGTAGDQIQIDLSSDEFDTYLILVAPDGSLIAQDDDSGNNTNSRILLTLPESGTYQILANSYSAGAAGRYILSWETTTTAEAQVTSTTITGQLNENSDQLNDGRYLQHYYLQGAAGERFAIEVVSADFKTSLSILGVNGERLASDNGYAGISNPRIAIELPETGQYLFAVISMNPGDTGNYALSVTPIADEDWPLEQARNLYTEGLILFEQGQYVEATFRLEEALRIRREVSGDINYSVFGELINLSTVYREQNRIEDALSALQEAFRISVALYSLHGEFDESNLGLLATLNNNLGEIYMAGGLYDVAEFYYNSSLTLRRSLTDESDPQTLILVANSLHNVGFLYLYQGRFDESESLFRESLNIRRSVLGDNHPIVATALGSLGWLNQHQNRYSDAENLFRESLLIRQNFLGDQHPRVANVFILLAESEQSQGDITGAISSLQSGLDVEEFNLNLGLLSLPEEQRQIYAKAVSDTSNQAVSLHLQSASDFSEAADLALTTLLRRKGRILDAGTSSRQVLRQNLTPEDQVTLDRLTDTQRQLATLTFNPPPNLPLDQYRARLAELETEANQLESTLARRSAAFRAETQPIEIAAVAAQLPTNSVLVEYVRYRPFNAQDPRNPWGADRYAAYLLFPDGRIEAVDLGPAAEIDAAARDFIGLLQNPSATLRAGARPTRRVEDVQAVTGKMQALILDPIAPYLQDSDHLLISPDSQLNLIPFEALQSEAGGPFLIEQYQISYLNSGRDLLKFNVIEPSDAPAVVLANPDYEQASGSPRPSGEGRGERATELAQIQVGPLPGTAAEAEAIRPLLPNARILTEANATENALKTLPAPRILHIATHGFFLANVDRPGPNSRGLGLRAFDDSLASPPGVAIENPLLRSGLALAGFNPRQSGSEDGVLTALEASQLNLFGTQLVVLSACDTGLGEVANGEGVYGLRRAFAIAGAESQLLSLWQVDDFGTQSLMARYYENLTAGMGRSEALRQVQLEMIRADDRYSHPYYWAAFILAGDWRPLD